MRCVDPARETVPHQRWKIAAVVDVGVGEEHIVDRRRLDGKPLPVPQAQFFETLKQAAIDQHTAAAVLQKET